MLRAHDLTPAIVATIKGMLKRGDRQFDIATWWDMPLTHVSNIATGKRGREIVAAPLDTLPPPAPYQLVSVDAHARLQEAAAVPTRTLQELLSRLDTMSRQLATLEKHIVTHGKVQVVDRNGSSFAVPCGDHRQEAH